MNIKHQLPMRSVFFSFCHWQGHIVWVRKAKRQRREIGRGREREWPLGSVQEREESHSSLVSQISRRQSAGDCSNILKHAVFKWLRFSWRLWSRKDRVKDVKNHGCFCETKYPVSAGTDKRLPYARTESVIGLCFLLLTHAQYTVHTDISINFVGSRKAYATTAWWSNRGNFILKKITKLSHEAKFYCHEIPLAKVNVCDLLYHSITTKL